MILLITLSFLLCSLIYSQREFPSFEEYKIMFNKTYSEEENIERKQNYKINIEAMKNIVEFEPDVNELTDWSQEEFDSLKNLQLESETQSFNEEVPVGNARLGGPTPTTYPESLDWREKNVVTPAKNQGRCGSCAAFAAVGAAESKLIIEGRYDQSIDLSENYILHCKNIINCKGGPMDSVMWESTKLPQEFQSRYSPIVLTPQCPARKIHIAKGASFFHPKCDMEIIEKLQNGPIAASIDGDSMRYYAPKSDIIRCTRQKDVNHAVLIVGYTPTYWIIKNSWGTSFGKDGFANVSRLRNESCLLGHEIYYFVGNPYEDNSTEEVKYNSESLDVEHDNAFRYIEEDPIIIYLWEKSVIPILVLFLLASSI